MENEFEDKSILTRKENINKYTNAHQMPHQQNTSISVG